MTFPLYTLLPRSLIERSIILFKKKRKKKRGDEKENEGICGRGEKNQSAWMNEKTLVEKLDDCEVVSYFALISIEK